MDSPRINFMLELSSSQIIVNDALADTGADSHGLFIPMEDINTDELIENLRNCLKIQ